jgi:galactofuranosylgalactofuranosylrhamnosyl-N-acetylglucosaminyl-diphospho-decaprenol beta-1,5/1,6-galactofuranosyltransferase
LARRFDAMRRQYRDALPMLSSTHAWETVLLPETRQ